jgi:hypothetical protein
MSNITKGVAKFFSGKKVDDEALNLLDKNVGTINNLITHVTFISNTIDDLIAIIEGMGDDDADYKRQMLEKAQSINTEFTKLKTALYTASDSADTKAEEQSEKYKTTGTTKANAYARKGKKPEKEKEDDIKFTQNQLGSDAEKEKAEQREKEREKAQARAIEEAKLKKKGGNPYKTAKKQLTNLISNMMPSSTKTQKKHRKH